MFDLHSKNYKLLLIDGCFLKSLILCIFPHFRRNSGRFDILTQASLRGKLKGLRAKQAL